MYYLPTSCRKYGCNICGEGGEYETLTLDCPMFRRASIVLDAWQTLVQSEDDIAPVGVLHPVQYHLVAKEDFETELCSSSAEILEVTQGAPVPSRT